MADTELTQLEPKAATLLVACSDTIFAPGNRLADPVLLKRLETTEPLTPTAAADLATFLSQYPGNKSLAEHVAEFALISIATDSRLQPIIQQIVAFDVADWWEDFWDGGSDEPNIRRSTSVAASQTQPPYSQLFALPLLSGLALLVESHIDGEDISYFVIGVSPDPAELSSFIKQ
jgi:hypothetical protein